MTEEDWPATTRRRGGQFRDAVRAVAQTKSYCADDVRFGHQISLPGPAGAGQRGTRPMLRCRQFFRTDRVNWLPSSDDRVNGGRPGATPLPVKGFAFAIYRPPCGVAGWSIPRWSSLSTPSPEAGLMFLQSDL